MNYEKNISTLSQMEEQGSWFPEEKEDEVGESGHSTETS